jgi:hypothetical protein
LTVAISLPFTASMLSQGQRERNDKLGELTVENMFHLKLLRALKAY